MRPSLRLKLFLVLLTVTGLAVGGTWSLMQRAVERGFVRLVEARQHERVDAVTTALAREYEQAGGWQRLQADSRRWIAILLAARRGEGREPRWARRLRRQPPGEWPPRRRSQEDDGERRAGRTPLEFRMLLLDADRQPVVGRLADAGGAELSPVKVGDTVVGFLAVLPGPALNEIADIRFVEEQKRTFIIIAVLMVLTAAVLALPLASGMTRRIRRIAEGARALAAGRYATRVDAGGGDELGRLAVDFNELAAALDSARRDRRQWVADVSHELRTPLAVLRAELEAMQDGVRATDAGALESLHTGVMRLGRLVDDLYELSLADVGAMSYRKETLDPLGLLAEEVDALSTEFAAAGLRVVWDRSADPRVAMHGDPDRLAQLWSNLLANALRYTEPGGSLRVRAARASGYLVVDLDDTGPGVPDEHLPRLFERFHRVEGSRSREHGGAGLGLAICQRIVAAHAGHIEARHGERGGLWIRVQLPEAS